MAWGARRGSHGIADGFYPIFRPKLVVGSVSDILWMLQEGLTDAIPLCFNSSTVSN